MPRPLVIIESPYGRRPDGSAALPSERSENMVYLWDCVRDSIHRGEAPFASHGFYTYALVNETDEQRAAGMECGLAWGEKADLVAVYVDRGITEGMFIGIQAALRRGQKVVYRSLVPMPEWFTERVDHPIASTR